jgi:S-adenosylmethionine:tRNA ribosyltransferase-isomerase
MPRLRPGHEGERVLPPRVPSLDFELLPAHEAHEPPEARGLARDGVRLMVTRRGEGTLVHARFRDLPDFLQAGDLLVLNVSALIPAALPARRADGTRLELRLSTPAPDGRCFVELRLGTEPFAGGSEGECLALPHGGYAELLGRYAGGRRLWLSALALPEPLDAYLAAHGAPIRYGYVSEPWPLEAYENVYAVEPGSVEPPSAGRPFTPELLTRLVAAGVLAAPVVLHTGVSSLERGETPYPERFRVPEQTARLVNAVHGWGGRVIAVGTTVVRALESVADEDGTVRTDEGWTSLVVSPSRRLRTVDGLLTGWHEPKASHLQLLQAAAGKELLERSYRAALDQGYLWHEFGDSQLVLP